MKGDNMAIFLSAGLLMIIWTELAQSAPSTTPVKRPVIGILTQELSSGMETALEGEGYKSYLASSYVKYFESGGAQVIPVLVDQDEEYYKEIVDSVNGLVFPGGGSSITSKSLYGQAGKKLYDLVMEKSEAGVQIPLLGICLGFQMLMYLGAGGKNPLTSCNAKNMADPLEFIGDYHDSQIFGEAPKDVIDTLTTSSSTSNFHKWCITEEKFEDVGLQKNFKIVSTTDDGDGITYISTVEHKDLPLYGLQWHPEKNLFEWVYGSIPHDRKSVRASQYVVNFFVEKARNAPQKFGSEDYKAENLIYNFDSVYIRKLFKSSFMECYFFK